MDEAMVMVFWHRVRWNSRTVYENSLDLIRVGEVFVETLSAVGCIRVTSAVNLLFDFDFENLCFTEQYRLVVGCAVRVYCH